MLGGVRPAQGGGGTVEILARRAAEPVVEELLIAAGVGQGQVFAGQVVEIAALLLLAGFAQPLVAVVEIRRGEVIPDAAGCFLAGVLRLGDGPVLGQEASRVAVEHRAHIFAVDEHVLGVDRPAAHEAPAVGVEHVLDVLHFRHVRGVDGIVARLPEEDGRVVAVGEDDVSHQLHPLIPLAAEVFPLLVACGLSADHAVPVISPHIRRTACHMHEADVVRAAFPDEQGVQVVHPFRHDACGSPLVGGTLGVPPEPYGLAVDGHAVILVIPDLAEAGLDDLAVHRFAVHQQRDVHPVQRRIVEAPEADAAESRLCVNDLGANGGERRRGDGILVGGDVVMGAFVPDVGVLRGDADAMLPRLRWSRGEAFNIRGERSDFVSRQGSQGNLHLGLHRRLPQVADFRFHMQRQGLGGDVIVRAVDIAAVGLQIGVKREGQVHILLEDHLHGLADAAQHRVEVVAVPEEAHALAVSGDGLLLGLQVAARRDTRLVGGLRDAEGDVAGGGVVSGDGDDVAAIG